jgi:hypothetical protein
MARREREETTLERPKVAPSTPIERLRELEALRAATYDPDAPPRLLRVYRLVDAPWWANRDDDDR